MQTVTIYSRPGCHLCEKVKRFLLFARQRQNFHLVEVNIEDDPELLERYREKIPVVAIDDRPPVKYRVGVESFLEDMLGQK